MQNYGNESSTLDNKHFTNKLSLIFITESFFKSTKLIRCFNIVLDKLKVNIELVYDIDCKYNFIQHKKNNKIHENMIVLYKT